MIEVIEHAKGERNHHNLSGNTPGTSNSFKNINQQNRKLWPLPFSLQDFLGGIGK